MSVEVATRTLLFYEKKSDQGEGPSYEPTESCTASSSQSQPDKEDRPFWANYIHDLESIWWISVWILYKFRKATEKRVVITDISKEHSQNLFLASEPSSFRLLFLMVEKSFMSYIKSIPHPIHSLVGFVINFRKLLVSAYKNEEIDMKEDSPIYMADECTLHKEILELLKVAQGKDNYNDKIVLVEEKITNDSGITGSVDSVRRCKQR